jgi:HD-like signal output (HDOD) protein
MEPPIAAPRPLPAELARFRPVRATELDAARRETFVRVFQNIPRPPRLLHKLLSPDFVTNASSAELADLIVAEPLLATKLLSTINSPLYGLRSPVASVDQAVTLLGLTAVRALCLQYLVMHSFKADSRERQLLLEATWNASGLACELTQRLAVGLGVPDPGSLVSQVVLTFLGRLATVATMPRGMLNKVPARDLLARSSAEQALLGLSASEVGRLLMAHWGLPEAVAGDAADIDGVLVTPYQEMEPVRASRLGLSYLCARLGERLAADPTARLEGFDLMGDPDPEMHHIRSYLEHPALAGLVAQLSHPVTVSAINRLRRSMQAPELP